jgi:hypothetical protein
MTHKHYWKVDPPNGPTSPAVCAGCGAKADFPNAYDTTAFHINPLGFSKKKKKK